MDQIKGYPQVAKEAVQKLATHWAYYFFLSHLLEDNIPPVIIQGNEPFYVIGDSHVLSAAWMNMTVQGRQVYTVPKLVTGLKAWHLREVKSVHAWEY